MRSKHVLENGSIPILSLDSVFPLQMPKLNLGIRRASFLGRYKTYRRRWPPLGAWRYPLAGEFNGSSLGGLKGSWRSYHAIGTDSNTTPLSEYLCKPVRYWQVVQCSFIHIRLLKMGITNHFQELHFRTMLLGSVIRTCNFLPLPQMFDLPSHCHLCSQEMQVSCSDKPDLSARNEMVLAQCWQVSSRLVESWIGV